MLKGILKLFLGRTLVRYKGPENGTVALTFDDGPTQYTTQIIKTLEQYDSRATFFLLGHRAKENPDLMEFIEKTGNEMANHSWFHNDLTKISQRELKSEIKSVDSLLGNYSESPFSFRPPYGRLNLGLFWYLLLQRRRAVLWSRILGGDETHNVMSANDIDQELAESPLKSGDIVLLHDTSEGTANAMPYILKHIQAQGLRAVSLKEMLS